MVIRKELKTFLAIAVFGLLGIVIGSSLAPKQLKANALPCPFAVCDVDDNRCFNSDIAYKCYGAGVTGICSSAACTP